jgi:hypothetical protein
VGSSGRQVGSSGRQVGSSGRQVGSSGRQVGSSSIALLRAVPGPAIARDPSAMMPVRVRARRVGCRLG